MTINEIKGIIQQKVDLPSFISRFVKLKRQGVDWFGKCPFHNEKSPSFSVSKKGFYKCFGCGESGDAITFIMKHEKLGFIDAIKHIASLENLSVEFEEKSKDQVSAAKGPLEKINFVDKELLVKTLTRYDLNPLYLWLESLVGTEKAISLVADKFYVGTAKDRGTIFWQVDQFMRIRTAQRLFYNDDGHRKKEIMPKRLFTTAQGYKPCFFGEHQLLTCDHDTLIGLVESEKTAMLCSAYLPYVNDQRVVWIASSGMNGLTEEKMWVLRGMNVLLVPDFHFQSRMVWGVLPMRKAIDPVDGRLKPHPQGDLDEEYVSIAMKLQKLTCKVSFYDPWPDDESKQDIGDKLVLMDYKKQIERPDLESLILPESGF